ncbi:MAG: DUF1730 domain-containing protein [Clostridia bacterium]|nr:DUF1730 domain-containing protein [Clostridia bacterium]
MDSINNVMNSIAPVWGICSFDDIKDNILECRAKLRLPAGARSVAVFAFPYLLPDEKYEGLNISKYAVSSDYHDILSERLKEGTEILKEMYPGDDFVYFIDNSPIPEVEAACRAGVGVKGRNSLLITEKYGSFVFLGEIVTTLAIEHPNITPGVCCGCNRCVEACPAGALIDGKIDTDRCLSHITQKKGELSEEEKKYIRDSGCAWGCDICQDVCPMNKAADYTEFEKFLSTANASVNEDTPLEGRAYAWRGEKVIRRNLRILRNDYED